MKKKEIWVLAAFAVLIAAIFWDLATLNHAYLSGDHREQQYPWAKFYQEQIRQFHLPWWTVDFHCGFPLLAEGQIGAFYPLNYLFLLLLPVKVAYNYIILFQFWLGAALFYWFLRRLKLSVFPSFFSSLIFLLGSTQGGYFYYNYISQKVVIWLPLTLILIDRLAEKNRWQDGFWLAVVFAVQIFGGYLQVAVYSMFYSGLYFLFRWWERKDRKTLLYFSAAGLLGIFFSLVQLLPTIELSVLSSRADAPKGLAYVGSMNPFGLATLFYPSWDGFLGSECYIGLAGLLFAFICLFNLRSRDEKFFAGASVLFLLLALGSYSPLYRLIVETTGFNSFRTPIKFLFFVTFSLAVLAAYGAEKFFSSSLDFKRVRRPAFLLTFLCVLFLFIPTAAERVLSDRRPELLPKFQEFVVNAYHGKAGHPYSEGYYQKKAVDFYDGVIQTMGMDQKHTRWQVILLLAFLPLCLYFCFKPRPSRALMLICGLFLLTDLYFYGFTSIKGGELPFNTIDVPGSSRIIDFLKADKELFRVMEVYQSPEQNFDFPVFPSHNMLEHIQDIGAYSPLVMKKYKQFLEGWGYINDSLSIQLVDPEKLKARMSDVNFLNVKYLLSLIPLDHPSLELVMQEDKVFLYKNRDVLPRVFFVPKTASFDSLDAASVIPANVIRYDQASMTFKVMAPVEGHVLISDIYYHGWTTEVDGEEDHVRRARDLFRRVDVKPGLHTIEMKYSTGVYKVAGLTALFVFFWGCLEMLPFRSRKKEPVEI